MIRNEKWSVVPVLTQKRQSSLNKIILKPEIQSSRTWLQRGQTTRSCFLGIRKCVLSEDGQYCCQNVPLSVYQQVFKVHALLLPGRCLTSFYTTHDFAFVIKMHSFYLWHVIFQYLNVWSDLFKRNKLSKNIVVWACFGVGQRASKEYYTQVTYYQLRPQLGFVYLILTPFE